jgi:hypothetical protein
MPHDPPMIDLAFSALGWVAWFNQRCGCSAEMPEEAFTKRTLSIRGCESKQQPIVMYGKSLASFTGTDFCTSL